MRLHLTRKFNRQQYNNAIVLNELDQIILQYSIKLSVEEKAHENINSEFNKNDLYDIDNMALDENKQKTE